MWRNVAATLAASSDPVLKDAWQRRLRIRRELRAASSFTLECDIDRRFAERVINETWALLAKALCVAALGTHPVGKYLADTDEDRLCRGCYALAAYEAAFRAHVSPSWSIVRASRSRSLDALPAMASEGALADLKHLSRAFYRTQRAILAQPAVLNPTFDRSVDLGGADADLIVDGCPIDIKTSVNPRPRVIDFYQVLGYVLADTSDRYRISSVGLYLARQPELLRWPLLDYCEILAERPVNIEALRSEFAELVTHVHAGRHKKALAIVERTERLQHWETRGCGRGTGRY